MPRPRRPYRHSLPLGGWVMNRFVGGLVLLVLPLWLLSHHSAAIAEVVTRILLS